MGKKQLKGIRLESNWNTFEIEHSEVKLSKDCSGKILSVTLPDDYYLISIIFSNDHKNVLSLRYLTPDNKYVMFPK